MRCWVLSFFCVYNFVWIHRLLTALLFFCYRELNSADKRMNEIDVTTTWSYVPHPAITNVEPPIVDCFLDGHCVLVGLNHLWKLWCRLYKRIEFLRLLICSKLYHHFSFFLLVQKSIFWSIILLPEDQLLHHLLFYRYKKWMGTMSNHLW